METIFKKDMNLIFDKQFKKKRFKRVNSVL